MGRTIAVANQKGGVGKSTTAINLSACLAEQGKKVLTIDMDPQGNTTSGLGVDKNAVEDTLYELLVGQSDVETTIVKDVVENVDLIPSNVNLSGAEIELVGIDNKEYILKEITDKVKDNYDYIIIDCPPSLNMLTINALAAADTTLIPVQAQYLSAKGLEQLLQTVQKVRRQINPKLKIEGILLTMTDSRTNYGQQIDNLIRGAYGSKIKVFDQTIPRSVRAAEISAVGKSIFQHDPKGKVAEAYKSLTEEVMANAEKQLKRVAERGR